MLACSRRVHLNGRQYIHRCWLVRSTRGTVFDPPAVVRVPHLACSRGFGESTAQRLLLRCLTHPPSFPRAAECFVVSPRHSCVPRTHGVSQCHVIVHNCTPARSLWVGPTLVCVSCCVSAAARTRSLALHSTHDNAPPHTPPTASERFCACLLQTRVLRLTAVPHALFDAGSSHPSHRATRRQGVHTRHMIVHMLWLTMPLPDVCHRRTHL
jgi:hypothetical protein